MKKQVDGQSPTLQKSEPEPDTHRRKQTKVAQRVICSKPLQREMQGALLHGPSDSPGSCQQLRPAGS